MAIARNNEVSIGWFANKGHNERQKPFRELTTSLGRWLPVDCLGLTRYAVGWLCP